MFVKTEQGEQVGRDLFIDGLRSRTIRAKLRKRFSPINHTLQQIMAAAEETERKFAASFLEGEDYPKEGYSSELSRARAELVKVTWTRHEEHRQWAEYLELLIVQAWKTRVEGDLLEFLFGSVRPDHHQLIVQELTVPLAQLADDLPLEIVSQSDNSPIPHVLTQTLAPYLQWSACLEEPGSGRNPSSQRDYLSPYEIVDLSFFQNRMASENKEVEIEEEEENSEEEEGEEEDAEGETPEEGSYGEHNEGEQSPEEEDEEEEDQEELGESEWEGFEEEVRAEARAQAQAQKREEIAAGKRQLEFASAASQQLTDDPAPDPEPPKPEDGDPAAETSAAPARRRRSRSPSPSTSARSPIRPRTDAGHRASSPVVIPPSP
ncbi:hypothetical protein CBR_g3885 [Chara braunii]|uniref:Uncharacterized protein n=1 Tax=Chara braunii TaxID=69332 RepID=A0A388KGN8_CHABU|nr:hypothetical protein CBR_g3885 [Chara braunii]|eukprot:GBG69186.1 hypothetical protein CBR_g3885 [Chara braunii]